MCDLSERLIAWLDHELPENEAAAVERHVQACAECRSRLDAYKKIDKTFDAYCDAAMVASERRRLPRWVPVLSGAAAAVALFLLFPRGHVERLPLHVPAATASPAIVLEAPPAPISTRTHRRHGAAPVQSQTANWVPAEPAIQIAIPAEAMFAPGTIPEGVSFTAELSIAADGSAQRLRLRP